MPNFYVTDQVQIGQKLITDWQINAGLDPTTAELPTYVLYVGSLAHTPGYARVWELSEAGWVEL